VTVDSGTTGNVVIGATNNTNAKNVALGNNNAGSTVGIDAGTGSTGIEIGNTTTAHGIQIGSNATGDNDIVIGGTNTGSTLTLEAGTAAASLAIGNGATAHNIQIGTGAAVQTVTLGSTNGASDTNIQGGSGDITLTTSAGNTVQIGSGTSDTDVVLLQLDSDSDFSADEGTCNATTNQGAMYYNTTSNAIRSCINSGWEDIVTTAGLGLILFGVAPDSGSNPGDLASLVTPGASGPCKVSYLSASSVSVAPCVAYSSGRKMVIASTTSVTGLTTASRFYHICFNPATGALQALAGTSETNNLPTFSINNPVLCLADVQTNATPVISAVYDTRTFTNSIKQTVTVSATAAGLGMLVTLNGANVTKPAATAALANVQGVVVATDGATSTTNPNAIIVVNGPAVVKATAGSAGALIETGGTTAGYAITIAASATATSYTQIGFTKNAFPGTACTTTPNAANCNRSLYFYAISSK